MYSYAVKIIAITEDDDTLILDNNLNYNIDESVFTEGEETENLASCNGSSKNIEKQ